MKVSVDLYCGAISCPVRSIRSVPTIKVAQHGRVLRRDLPVRACLALLRVPGLSGDLMMGTLLRRTQYFGDESASWDWGFPECASEFSFVPRLGTCHGGPHRNVLENLSHCQRPPPLGIILALDYATKADAIRHQTS